jgi:hypothetical protein
LRDEVRTGAFLVVIVANLLGNMVVVSVVEAYIDRTAEIVSRRPGVYGEGGSISTGTATSPSGKARVCKTLTRGFDSRRGLQQALWLA